MEKQQRDLYYKGYVAGYRDGVKDAENGKTVEMMERDIESLPIEELSLSTRAYNCLTRAGCVYIGDIAALSEYSIVTMRGLGPKCASEIAESLDAHGICYSAWGKYL